MIFHADLKISLHFYVALISFSVHLQYIQVYAYIYILKLVSL